MVTYSDLIQIGILIVALVILIYEIIKDKRSTSGSGIQALSSCFSLSS